MSVRNDGCLIGFLACASVDGHTGWTELYVDHVSASYIQVDETVSGMMLTWVC